MPHVLSVFTVALLAAGCGRSDDGSPRSADEPMATAGRAEIDSDSPAPCPSTDFETFLNAFAEDTRIQARWTRFPLPQLRMEDGPEEPTPVEGVLRREETVFPLLPAEAKREAEGRRLRVEVPSEGVRRVVIEAPDTDWKVDYLFAYETCWTLVRVEDWSL